MALSHLSHSAQGREYSGWGVGDKRVRPRLVLHPTCLTHTETHCAHHSHLHTCMRRLRDAKTLLAIRGRHQKMLKGPNRLLVFRVAV